MALFGHSNISTGKVHQSLETENPEVFTGLMLEEVSQRLFEYSVRHVGQVTRIRVWITATLNEAIIFFKDDGIGTLQEKKEQTFLSGDATCASRGSLVFIWEILSFAWITIRKTMEPVIWAQFEIVVPSDMWRTAGKEL